MRRSITLVLPYYDNPTILREHQRLWRSYSRKTAPRLHVIVVDDGSPRSPALPHVEAVPLLGSYRLYRIGVDRRWNWLACRNLGMHQATTDWALLTDIDHLLPEATLRALLNEPLDDLAVYRLSRVDAPHLTPYKPHPNTWFLTRFMFDQIGGYDERFSGYYGTDAEFRERVHKTARAVIMRPDVLIRYPREVIADASTTTYGRKEPQDGLNVRRIRNERDAVPDWRPLRLTFPWELQWSQSPP